MRRDRVQFIRSSQALKSVTPWTAEDSHFQKHNADDSEQPHDLYSSLIKGGNDCPSDTCRSTSQDRDIDASIAVLGKSREELLNLISAGGGASEALENLITELEATLQRLSAERSCHPPHATSPSVSLDSSELPVIASQAERGASSRKVVPSQDDTVRKVATDHSTLHESTLARILKRRRADDNWPVEYLPGACFSRPCSFVCAVCPDPRTGLRGTLVVNGLERFEHDASTVHMFHHIQAIEGPVRETRVQLSAHNKGFQLLTRMGFDEQDGGLGVTRQGRLEPVATAFKTDRRGLGNHGLDPSQSVGDDDDDDDNEDGDASTSSSSSSSSSSRRAPRRVTHFPSHRPSEAAVKAAERAASSLNHSVSSAFENQGGRGGIMEEVSSLMSDAKRAQDQLGLRRKKQPLRGIKHQGSTNSSHQQKRRKNRTTMEARLQEKQERGIRTELYSSLPDDYSEFFGSAVV